ncbi:hypothetical protein HRbin41_00261 [bacterium HR41]|nr:hypothetical protein HRbin41_00261 [bacterium HR41]
MVGVVATLHASVHGETGSACHGAQEFDAQLDLEISHLLAREDGIEACVRAAGDVDHAPRERVVHRDTRLAEATDAVAVAERTVERAPEGEPGVLDGVVRPRREVAVDANIEVDLPVTRHGVEHVVEETNPGAALARTAAVKVEREPHVRFARAALNLGVALVSGGVCVHASTSRRGSLRAFASASDGTGAAASCAFSRPLSDSRRSLDPSSSLARSRRSSSERACATSPS